MKIKLLIYIALLGIILSCGRHDSRLKEVDSIMDSDPSTALARLDSICADELSLDDYAYYALLYTQAQDKCRIVNTSDSLISVAYGVYSHSGPADLRMRTFFYKAVVSFYKNDFLSAMKDAAVAYDIAKDLESSYWIAKSAELKADIFWHVYNYRLSEQCTHEAVKYYLLAGRVDNHRYALCDLATIYVNEGRLDDAKSLVDSIYVVVTNETPVDSALLDYMYFPLSSVLLQTNKFDELRQLLKEAPDFVLPGDEKVDEALMNVTVTYVSGDNDRASTLLSDAYQLAEDEKQRARVMYEEYRQAMFTGNYEKAALMGDSLLRIQSKIAEDVLSESVTAAQSDFYSEKAKYQQLTAERRLLVIVALAVVALIITILLIIIFRLKIRARNAEFEANLLSLMNIKRQADEIGLENKRLSSELTEKSIVVEHLFREKWGTLNALCREYFDKGDLENVGSIMLRKLDSELKKLRSDDSFKDIEGAVDTYMGNIMTLLRQECDFLKKDDFVFLSLLFAGMSTRSVCLLLDIKYKLFYLRKSRLSKRISESEAPHKELFLSKMN